MVKIKIVRKHVIKGPIENVSFIELSIRESKNLSMHVTHSLFYVAVEAGTQILAFLF